MTLPPRSRRHDRRHPSPTPCGRPPTNSLPTRASSTRLGRGASPGPAPLPRPELLEYVGLLTLVAAVLAAAGPAAGLAGVPARWRGWCRPGSASSAVTSAGTPTRGRQVWRRARCRTGGAAAARSRCSRSGSAVARVTVAQRSDGSVPSSGRARRGRARAPAWASRPGRCAVAPRAPRAHGRDATAGSSRTPPPQPGSCGRSARGRDARWPPAWRSGEAELATDGCAGLGVEFAKGEDAASAARSSASRPQRRRRSAPGSAAAEHDLPARGVGRPAADRPSPAPSASARSGPVIAEYTRDRAGPRELAFRVTAAGPRAARWSRPSRGWTCGSRRTARSPARLLRVRAPWPPAVARDLRAVMRHTARVGTIERNVYAVDRPLRRGRAGRPPRRRVRASRSAARASPGGSCRPRPGRPARGTPAEDCVA